MQQNVKESKNEKTRVQKEVKRAVDELKDTVATTSSLFISALTLVASLAWSDVAKAIFEKLKEKISGWGEIVGLLLYAVVVTVIVVLVVKRLQNVSTRIGGKSVKS